MSLPSRETVGAVRSAASTNNRHSITIVTTSETGDIAGRDGQKRDKTGGISRSLHVALAQSDPQNTHTHTHTQQLLASNSPSWNACGSPLHVCVPAMASAGRRYGLRMQPPMRTCLRSIQSRDEYAAGISRFSPLHTSSPSTVLAKFAFITEHLARTLGNNTPLHNGRPSARFFFNIRSILGGISLMTRFNYPLGALAASVEMKRFYARKG